MNTYKISAVISILSLCLQAYAGNSTFEIDPVHSSMNFEIRHLYSTFVGRFNSFSGKIVADVQKEDLVSVSAEVDVLSIDTVNKDRDKHLLSADFLSADKFPKATFKSTSVKKGEGRQGSVTGNISIAGVTKEVTFKGEFLGYGEDARGGRRIGLHAVASISRKDFGITYNHNLSTGGTVLGDDVKLILNLEAVESGKP